ncbi:MAG TPA: type II toxin-antitoxin system mRNA interferase toxin, RelE/StbE family [Selenomonas sp.]|jgi:mRNA interferase RelE/StbE|nr:type II toxin-antitoxin system mRNA interferase toxin, RelE/StbE family [Selenomonas sp.]
MSYRVETTARFRKEFKKLDRYTQRILKSWMEKHLIGCEDPRATGKGLTANLAGLWRYRIGDYRLICEIEDEELVILTLTVGHRSEIYRKE